MLTLSEFLSEKKTGTERMQVVKKNGHTYELWIIRDENLTIKPDYIIKRDNKEIFQTQIRNDAFIEMNKYY